MFWKNKSVSGLIRSVIDVRTKIKDEKKSLSLEYFLAFRISGVFSTLSTLEGFCLFVYIFFHNDCKLHNVHNYS